MGLPALSCGKANTKIPPKKQRPIQKPTQINVIFRVSLTPNRSSLKTPFSCRYAYENGVETRSNAENYVIPVIHKTLVPFTTLNHNIPAITSPTAHHLIHKL